jgi:SPP1 family predicted phage head-tail adaptor
MSCGGLKCKITIEQQSTTQNTYGEYPNSWTTFGTAWAEVITMNTFANREAVTANQEHSRIDVKFRIRYLSGTLPKMRVSFNSAYYDIKAVININEENRFMWLMCEKVVS